jgi:hypothetical protein
MSWIAWVLGGCAGGPGDSVPDTFESIQADILMPSCGFSTCHGSATGGLLLDGSDGDYNRLINAPSSPPPQGTGMVYVQPGDSENSYLVLKVSGAEGIMGDPMPDGTEGLDEDLVERIRIWIDEGAAP